MHDAGLISWILIMRKAVLYFALVALASCGSTEATPERAAHIVVVDSPRTIVDSVFPLAEDIRRFKAARNGVATRRLTGGASSRDALVHKFIAALETNDSAALANLILTAAEFIDLYYPSSIYSAAPYRQSPELRWFLMQENSNQGYHRLLQRYGGSAAGFTGYTCTDTARVEGENRIHDRCAVEWSRDPATLRAFSTIIERHGRFKFMSYANDL